MFNDTLIIVGVEGVIRPIVPCGVLGDPTLMGEALVGIINLESNLCKFVVFCRLFLINLAPYDI